MQALGCCGNCGGQAKLALAGLQLKLDPAVAPALTNLRNSLRTSAQNDRQKICKPPVGDELDPYGSVVACIADHVRHDLSDFRKGLRSQFQIFRSYNNKAAADQFMPLAEAAIAVDAMMRPEEVHQYVVRDYQTIFGTEPSTNEPSRFSTLVTMRPGSSPTPTPLPSTGGGTIPIPRFKMGGGSNGGDVVTGNESSVELEQAAKKAVTTLAIGGVVLAGAAIAGIYFLTRKNQ